MGYAAARELRDRLGEAVFDEIYGVSTRADLSDLTAAADDLAAASAEIDGAVAARYSGAPDYRERATEAIDEMFRQVGPYELGPDGMLKKGVVIRHLLLPGHVADTIRIIKYIGEHFRPGDILFSLMRIDGGQSL